MSNNAWLLKHSFLREVSKLFKCYVLVKNFDRKPAISLKTLKIGYFNKLLRLNQGFAGAAKSFLYLFIYLDIITKPLCFLVLLL